MNHSPNTEQREREAFEVWSKGHAPGHSRAINENGSYADYATECAWAGWHARATQAAPASPEPDRVGSRSQDELEHMLRSATISGCAVTLNHIEAGQFLAFLKPQRAPASPNTGAVAWLIEFTSPDGVKDHVFLKHNAVGDYRAKYPDATARALGEIVAPSPSKGGELAAARELIAAFESSMEGCRDQSWAEWENGHGENVGKRIEEARTAYAARKGGEAAPADPCPQCQPGGVCKTPACGRLRSSELMALYGTGKGGEADSAAEGRAVLAEACLQGVADGYLYVDRMDDLTCSICEETIRMHSDGSITGHATDCLTVRARAIQPPTGER